MTQAIPSRALCAPSPADGARTRLSSGGVFTSPMRLRERLRTLDARDPTQALRSLCEEGFDHLPLPGAGRTLQRWQALSEVGAKDLSLAKFYEGHTDALAILSELERLPPVNSGIWAVWAAEPPQARVELARDAAGSRLVQLNGRKSWCSGAAAVNHALLTVWDGEQGSSPDQWLAAVDLREAGVSPVPCEWHAVGMAATASLDVEFDDAPAVLVGAAGDYLRRPGFWHGGAGIAACWYGAATALAETLRAKLSQRGEPHGNAHLGAIDVALQQAAAVLREAAAGIDADPRADAMATALRMRAAVEACARSVLDLSGRSLGAAAFCRDAHFARLAADLPVFMRQSHAEHDLEVLGREVAQGAAGGWSL